VTSVVQKIYTQSATISYAAGVKSGWLLKSVNSKDVLGMEFAHILDLLDDEVMDQRMSQHFYASEKAGRLAEPVELPITVVYQEGAGQDIEWPQMKLLNDKELLYWL